MSADLVIRGGTVLDGTGAPGVAADVAVTAGRIVEIGPKLTGARELDAAGHVVAPGFIDIHTHYDAQVFWDAALTPSCFHGVTTVVAGNCGFSIAPTRPGLRGLLARTLEKVEDMDAATLAAGIVWDFETFPEYLAAVERRGIGLNFAAYLGHTALRLYALGDAAYERAATDAEIATMAGTLQEGLLAGAAGFATSYAPTHHGADGLPIPSRLAERAELDALIDVVGRTRRGVLSIAPGGDVLPAEFADLQRRAGVPLTWGALLTMPSGAHRATLALMRRYWADGAEIWPQVSPRPLAFSMTLAAPFTLNSNPAFGALETGGLEARRAAYADRDWRDKACGSWANRALAPRYETYEVMESSAHPELVGRRLTEVAADAGTDPFDALLDLALAEPDLSLRVRCILANDAPEEIAVLLREEHCTLGLSDAGAHLSQLCDAPQATDLLGSWVRERQVLELPEAVRKLAKAQADLFGLVDRGELRPGAWADVVVFDPDTVGPGPLRRVRDFPAGGERLTADAPTGVRHVLVNGVPIRVDEAQVDDGARPGQIVRPPERR